MLSRKASVAFVALLSIALLLLIGRSVITVRDADISDFRCFYGAATIARAGGDPYDPGTWSAAVYTDPTRVPHCARSFIYPFWTALALVPLTVLPEQAAVAAWEVIILSCVGAAALLIARTRPLIGDTRVLLLTIAWSQPLFSAVANAQFGPVIFAGVAVLAFALERSRATLAGVAWLALLIKPHLSALVLLVALAAKWGRWMVATLAATIALLMASQVVLSAWPARWLRAVLDQRLDVDAGLSSLWTLAADAGLASGLGALVSFIAAAAYILAARRFARAPFELLCVAVTVTLIVTPYARPHDLIVLALPASLALAAAKRADHAGRRELLAGFVMTMFVLPWAITLASLFGLPLASYVAIALLTAVLTLRAMRVSEPGAGSAAARSDRR